MTLNTDALFVASGDVIFSHFLLAAVLAETAGDVTTPTVKEISANAKKNSKKPPVLLCECKIPKNGVGPGLDDNAHVNTQLHNFIPGRTINTRVKDESRHSHSAWWKVLSAPWVGVVSPSWACSTLDGARTTTIVILAFILAAVWSFVGFLSTLFWFGIERKLVDGKTQIVIRSIGDVWYGWQLEGWFGTGGHVGLVCVTVFVVVMLVVAAMHVVSIHRTSGFQGLLCSYGRSIRAVLAIGGWVVILSAVLGNFVGIARHQFMIVLPKEPSLAMVLAWVVAATSACFLTLRMSRCTALLRDRISPTLPPRCETCGYDLSHTDMNGRCQECGDPCTHSIGRNRIRQGWAWQSKPTAWRWMVTTFHVVFGPTHFYSRLSVRRDSDEHVLFGRIHLFVIAMMAATWIFCMLSFADGSSQTTVTVVSLVVFLVPIFGWLTHRVVMMACTGVLLTTNPPEDFRWAWVAMCYETAFLWCFCAVGGCFITGGVLSREFREIVRSVAAYLPVIAPPPDLILLLMLELLLAVVWIWRMNRVVAAIRFNNS